jgi:NAD(P)-dependent dehydrogenase (short-subunit alcohol dehydrogenase family)
MSTILITGANGNLGQAVTHHLLDKGYSLMAAGAGSAEDLPSHDRLKFHQADLIDEATALGFAEKVIRESGDLEAAVLLVGGFAMGKLVDTSKDELEKMIGLNFYTAYHLVRPLLKHFLSRPEGGQIILVGSRPGLDAASGKDFFAYSLSKSMIFKLAEFINAEGRKKNVTATVIVPSTIDTPATRKAMPDTDFSSWVPPERIAEVISFALTPAGKMLRENILKVYNRA